VIGRLRRLLGPVVAAAAAGGLAWALWSRREALSAFDWQVSWPALVLSALLFAVAPLVQAGVFHFLLRRLGARPRADATLAVWTRGFLARYAPSGVVGYAVRVRQRERLAADAETVWTASVYEQLVALVSGAAAAVAGFLLAGVSPPVAASALLAGVAYAAWYGLDRALGRGLFGQLLSVGGGLGLGAVVYAATVHLMRIPEARQIERLLAGRLLKRGER
jgi:ABC-type Fe3+-siderophore transport system permease subunit